MPQKDGQDKLTWRMYGLVPYNISEIQKGIQFGHGVVEYAEKYFSKSTEYHEWSRNHKTFIILNGGTHQSMLDHTIKLSENDVKTAYFREPDLNDMLSAVVFLVDSRVYDRETYPDFYFYCLKIKGRKDLPHIKSQKEMVEFVEAAKEMEVPDYKEWVEFIGGETNLFLRDYLSNLKLA